MKSIISRFDGLGLYSSEPNIFLQARITNLMKTEKMKETYKKIFFHVLSDYVGEKSKSVSKRSIA